MFELSKFQIEWRDWNFSLYLDQSWQFNNFDIHDRNEAIFKPGFELLI